VSIDLEAIYANRFSDADRVKKAAVWRVLCRDFFQRYVPKDAAVLDLGAGFCEFLTFIECRERIAVDMNPTLAEFAPPRTRLVHRPATDFANQVGAATVDVVFVSNFFEHLPDKFALALTLNQIARVLRPKGRLLVLQPNISAIGDAYWDFADHHIALNHRSLAEAVAAAGFRLQELIPKFLPYTTRSRWPQAPWLVRLYLSARPIWWIMGGQTWLVAEKLEGSLDSRDRQVCG
jgi:SAM-dependent methyltransferase